MICNNTEGDENCPKSGGLTTARRILIVAISTQISSIVKLLMKHVGRD